MASSVLAGGDAEVPCNACDAELVISANGSVRLAAAGGKPPPAPVVPAAVEASAPEELVAAMDGAAASGPTEQPKPSSGVGSEGSNRSSTSGVVGWIPTGDPPAISAPVLPGEEPAAAVAAPPVPDLDVVAPLPAAPEASPPAATTPPPPTDELVSVDASSPEDFQRGVGVSEAPWAPAPQSSDAMAADSTAHLESEQVEVDPNPPLAVSEPVDEIQTTESLPEAVPASEPITVEPMIAEPEPADSVARDEDQIPTDVVIQVPGAASESLSTRGRAGTTRLDDAEFRGESHRGRKIGMIAAAASVFVCGGLWMAGVVRVPGVPVPGSISGVLGGEEPGDDRAAVPVAPADEEETKSATGSGPDVALDGALDLPDEDEPVDPDASVEVDEPTDGGAAVEPDPEVDPEPEPEPEADPETTVDVASTDGRAKAKSGRVKGGSKRRDPRRGSKAKVATTGGSASPTTTKAKSIKSTNGAASKHPSKQPSKPPSRPPQSVSSAGSSAAAMHYKQGNLYLKEKKVALAIDELKRCVAASPRYGMAYRSLGIAYMLLGREKSATQAYEKFVTLEPRHKEVPRVREIIAAYRKRNPG